MATVINKLISALNDSRSFTTAQAIRWANRAERDVAIKSGCLRNIDTVQTAAATRTSIFSGLRVAVIEYLPTSGVRRALFRIVPRQLGRSRTEGPDPKFYFQWGSRVGIDPLPNGVFNLNLHVVDFPEVEMTSAADSPTVPTDFEDLIVIYGQFMAALKDRRFSRASTLYAQYRRQVFERGYSETNFPDSQAGLTIQERSTGKVK